MTSKFVEQTVINRLVLDSRRRKIHMICEVLWPISPAGQRRGNKSAFWGAKMGGAA
jgi:hypothetical protein